jgi:hypothetical protein
MTRSSLAVSAGAVLAACAALLAGCGNSGTTAAPPLCSTGNVVLVYPAPNATAIPDNFPGIVFGASTSFSTTAQALLVQSGSTTPIALGAVGVAPTPLPTPNAIPTFGTPTYAESAANGFILAATTVYSVYYNDYSSSCTPALVGSFTSK